MQKKDLLKRVSTKAHERGVVMRIIFSHRFSTPDEPLEDYKRPSLREDIEKTRQALEIAYAGFDNAVDADMIDCYIYEINALLKRYRHLSQLAASSERLSGIC